jgi:small-conductance mechanosensitive channel
MDWTFVVMESVREMLTRIGIFIPKLIGLLLILIIGWLLAKFIESFIVRSLKLIRLDTLAEKSGTSNFLAKGGIKYTLSELIGVLVYWLVVLMVFITALNAMQWTVAAEVLNVIVGYIPNIIISVFILVLGMFVSTLLSTVIRTAASNAGITQAKLLGQITQIAVIVFASLMALQQLKIETGIILNVINIVLAATGLALGLAFGLGCKDVAGRFVEDIVNKMKKK